MKLIQNLKPNLGIVSLVGCLFVASCGAAEPATVIPAPQIDNAKEKGELQTAIFSGGCFWGVQGVYEHVRGVKSALSGYAGGNRETAQYEQVSTGATGHAESVQITYDPSQVSYGELLHIFFSVVHDPTQLNHQGFDTGTQYRSAIFYTDESQKKFAQAYIAQLNNVHVFGSGIVTVVQPSKGFYPAENYHQDYLFLHPENPYIAHNDLPKIENLKRIFPQYYRDQPVLIGSFGS